MNTYFIAGFPISDELYHYGILGQKWGVRRFQNPDGTLTEAGKKRYRSDRQLQYLHEASKKYPGIISPKSRAESRVLDFYDSMADAIDLEGRGNRPPAASKEVAKAMKKGFDLVHKIYERSSFLNEDKLDREEFQNSNEYKKIAKEIMKTRYDIIDQVIKDMGYEVTNKARKIMDEEFSSEIPYWYIPE